MRARVVTTWLCVMVAGGLASTDDRHPPHGEHAFAREAREALALRTLAALHQEDVPGALAASAELRRRWPEHPMGALLAANVYQTQMRDYRVRTHQAEFDACIREAHDRSRALADRAPSAEAFFALGTARGYRAVHRFSQGEWLSALSDAMKANGDMKRALARDGLMPDPLLALALYDFWKSEKLSLGLGLFSGGRKKVVERLDTVWKHGRYLRIEAAYALQTVHLREGRHAQALEVNDWLQQRFPRNPIGLYHRALITEALDRSHDALAAWDALIERIQAHPQPSDGFLAECHLHRAQLLSRIGRPAEAALSQARHHAARRDGRRELEGPFASFDDIRKGISRLAEATAKTASGRTAAR